jgi:hypothetical protein
MGRIKPDLRELTAARALAPGEEPPLAAHLVTPRTGYLHHGVYVGNGRVIHYAGFTHGVRRGPVEEVSLEGFARGRPVAVRVDRGVPFDSREVVERCRSRLGENRYRVLSNNCEHFCEWCLRATSRSYQVERLLSRATAALALNFGRRITAWLERCFSAGLSESDRPQRARWPGKIFSPIAHERFIYQ